MRYLAALFFALIAFSSADAQQQLLQIQRNWTSLTTLDAAIILRDCIEVKSDATYRLEHTVTDFGHPERHQIHVGKLSQDDMKHLQGLLEAPELQALSTPKPTVPSMTVGTDVDTYWFSIERGDHRQLLFFDSTSSAGLRSTSGTRMPGIYQVPSMKPLLSWYKQLAKRKNDLDNSATPTCSFSVRY